MLKCSFVLSSSSCFGEHVVVKNPLVRVIRRDPLSLACSPKEMIRADSCVQVVSFSLVSGCCRYGKQLMLKLTFEPLHCCSYHALCTLPDPVYGEQLQSYGKGLGVSAFHGTLHTSRHAGIITSKSRAIICAIHSSIYFECFSEWYQDLLMLSSSLFCAFDPVLVSWYHKGCIFKK